MPKINLKMQAANRAFSMRIAKDVLQDLRKQYPGVAARARLAKPRHVEQAFQQPQTQPTLPSRALSRLIPTEHLSGDQLQRHRCASVRLLLPPGVPEALNA